MLGRVTANLADLLDIHLAPIQRVLSVRLWILDDYVTLLHRFLLAG
jgi:hypothetical protein